MIEANRQRLSRQHDESIARQREPSPIVTIGETRSDIQLSRGELADGGSISGVKIFNTKSEGQIVSAIKHPASAIGTFDDLSTQTIRRKKKSEEEDEEDRRKRKKGKKKVTLFWLFLTFRTGNTITTVTAADYEQYNEFVSGGLVLRDSEDLVKEFGGIRVEVISKFDKSIDIDIEIVNMPYPTLTPPEQVLTGYIEVWTKKPNPDKTISASRKVFYTNVVPSGFSPNFVLRKGNPGDRTEPSTLQSNGYYKAVFNYIDAGAPTPTNGGLLNFFNKAVFYPKSSPLQPDIINP